MCILSSQANLHTLCLILSCPLWPHFLPLTSFSFFDLIFFLWPHFFLWPSTSKFIAYLKTLPSSLLCTWPSSLLSTCLCQRTLFAIANWSIVSINLNISIKSINRFLSLSCTPHIALSVDLFDHCEILISLSFTHNVLLPYSIAGLT